MIVRFPGQIFRVRRFGLAWLALALGTAVVMLPGSATASSRAFKTLYQINTSSVTKKGFQLHLYGFQTDPGYGSHIQTTLSVILKKTSGHATQTVQYTFNKGVKLTGSTNLSTATLSGKLGDNRGSINLTWHGSGATHPAPVPKACKAGGHPGHRRSGTFKGTLTLKADNLGTIKVNSVKSTLSTMILGTCIHKLNGYLLEGYKGIQWYVDATKASTGSPVGEKIELAKSAGGANPAWAFAYTYSIFGAPTTDYVPGSNLSTATMVGTDGITGTATYSGKKGTKHSNGHVSGSLSVTMAALGPETTPSSMPGDQRKS